MGNLQNEQDEQFQFIQQQYTAFPCSECKNFIVTSKPDFDCARNRYYKVSDVKKLPQHYKTTTTSNMIVQA